MHVPQEPKSKYLVDIEKLFPSSRPSCRPSSYPSNVSYTFQIHKPCAISSFFPASHLEHLLRSPLDPTNPSSLIPQKTQVSFEFPVMLPSRKTKKLMRKLDEPYLYQKLKTFNTIPQRLNSLPPPLHYATLDQTLARSKKYQ